MSIKSIKEILKETILIDFAMQNNSNNNVNLGDF